MPPRQQVPPAPPQQPSQPPIAPTAATAAGLAKAGAAPSAALAKAAVAAAVKTIESAFALRLRAIPPEILGTLRTTYAEITAPEASRIARLEIAREREFQRRVLARVRKDLADALRIENADQRAKRIQEILDREARYGRMREEAMQSRAVALAEQEILKATSPEGAFWRLSDLTAGNHTADCVAMANKWWPWSVLSTVHPPLHPNCPCALHGFAEARARGWMSGDVPPDTSGAVGRARAILAAHPEHSIARRELSEADSLHDFNTLLHPRNRVGRFRDVPGRAGWGVVDMPNVRARTQAARDEIADALNGFSYGGLNASVRSKHDERINLRFWPEGNLKREAGFAQVSVYADRLHIDRVFLHDRHQGQGFGSAFTMELFDAARAAGIERATLETVDVGGYAWARAGFLFDRGSSAEKILNQAVDDGTMDAIAEHYGEAAADGLSSFVRERERSEYEVAMWGRELADAAGFWPGKQLMIDRHWHGQLDLTALREADGADAVTRTWEEWTRAGRLHSPPDDVSGDDDLGFWDAVDAALAQSAREARWEEFLHPRNRLGKFRGKPGLASPAPAHLEQQAELEDALDRLRGALVRSDHEDPPAIEGYHMQPLAGALGVAGFTLADASERGDRQETVWVHGATGATLTIESRDQMVHDVGWEPGRPQEARRAERPIRSWAELRDDALALSDELAARFGAAQRMRGFGVDDTLHDTAGLHDWSGDAWIGPDAQDAAEVAGGFRGEGEDVPEEVLGALFFAEHVSTHEISHSVNPIAYEDYAGFGIHRALEEALTEEASSAIVVRRLRERGETDVLGWLRGNQARPYGQGTYHSERAALQHVLDQAKVAPEDREETILHLKFGLPPGDRLDYLGTRLLDAGHSQESAIEVLKGLDVESPMAFPARLGPFNVAPDLEGIEEPVRQVGFGRRVYTVGQEIVVQATTDSGVTHEVPARVVDGTEHGLIVQTSIGLARISDEGDIVAVHDPGELELPQGTAHVGEEIEYGRPDGGETRGRLVKVHRRAADDFLAEVRLSDRTVLITPSSTRGVRVVGSATNMRET